jgi:hypothetical protein
MPHPEDLKALHLIADCAGGQMRIGVAEAERAGVRADPLRNLQLEGCVLVMDDNGHPTIFITDVGWSHLRPGPQASVSHGIRRPGSRPSEGYDHRGWARAGGFG